MNAPAFLLSGNKIYYSMLLGALGGATAWLLLTTASGDPASWVTHARRGAVLGCFIGLLCSSYDAFITGSMPRILKVCGIGFGLGLVAGAIALPLAQTLYASLSNDKTPQAVQFLAGLAGWVVLGSIIGAAEGVGKGSQVWKAMLGGFLGAVVGGTIFEIFGRTSLEAVEGVTSAAALISEQRFVGLALTLLGASIGMGVALVTSALSDAWFSVNSGKLAGTTINVSKYVAARGGSQNLGVVGGSSWEASIYLPGDPDIRARHATLALTDGAPTLALEEHAARAGARLVVNGREVTRWPLSDGDTVRVGTTEMTYRHKRQ